ncbi:MAG: ABC transporter permease subunit [Verrucomicrobiota bacterium]|nr:ABC transporter permease subunit [Verrucomicrobiota bacterium]
MFRLDPITRKKFTRFRSIKRGYFSFLILVGLIGISLMAELLVNNRALVVKYNGDYTFPTYGAVEVGKEFGVTGVQANTPVNYRQLKETFKNEGKGNWVIMPLVPYSPYENTTYQGVFKPAPPSTATEHYLGTDSTGRDILARCLYGFRTAIFFAFAFLILTYMVGITIGCLMGYFGGWADLLGQRLIEVWSSVPFLYMVIIITSVMPSTLPASWRIGVLLNVLVLFSWIGITYYMRTATYKEKARDYVAAAIVLGAGTPRIIFTHIFPNILATVVTFIPFTVAAAINSITALDFLGFGLPPPTPSIGELLKQGTANLSSAPWIVSTAVTTLVIILTLVTFIGEAIREAFDPKKHTFYQ